MFQIGIVAHRVVSVTVASLYPKRRRKLKKVAHPYQLITYILPLLIVHPQVRVSDIILQLALSKQRSSKSLGGLHNPLTVQIRTHCVKYLRPVQNRTIEVETILGDKAVHGVVSCHVG